MSQVESGLASIYGKDPDWDTVIQAIDTNRDGMIDYDEFMTAASNRSKLLNKTNLEAAYRNLDKNSDGKITAEEIQFAFSRGNLSELGSHGVGVDNEFWDKLVSNIDTNNDGAIDFEEFENYML